MHGLPSTSFFQYCKPTPSTYPRKLRIDNSTGNTDHGIALAISVLMHAIIILIACWPSSDLNQNTGTMQNDGSGDLVVQFVSLDRSIANANPESPAPETAVTEDLTPETENQDQQPDRDKTPTPIDSVATESVPDEGARSPSTNESSNGSQLGSSGTGDDLESRYIATLKATIYSKWKTSNGGKLGSCDLTIQQAIGGSVLTAKLVNCNLSPAEQRAFEAATLMAQPLPYAGFESVFVENRTINVEL